MNNILVKHNGDIIKCPAGVEHHRTCWQELHYDLDDFLLHNGGLRIKVYGENIAMEFYGELSSQQKAVIRQYLRQNNYYTAILANEVIKKFRPIRSLEILK